MTTTPSEKTIKAQAKTKLTPYQHYLKGLQLKALGKHDEAISELKSSIEMSPKFSRAYVELARIYLKQDKHKDTSLLHEAVIKLDPDCADMHYVKDLAQFNESVKPESHFPVL